MSMTSLLFCLYKMHKHSSLSVASLSFEYVDYLKHCLCAYKIIGFVSLEVVTIINTVLIREIRVSTSWVSISFVSLEACKR